MIILSLKKQKVWRSNLLFINYIKISAYYKIQIKLVTKIEKNINTFGLVVELTKSQSDNFRIIRNHWIIFNQQLKEYKLNQKNENWEKYGITLKFNEKYFYLASIELNDKESPSHFTSYKIPKGDYKIFTHRGKMENIKDTIYKIYKIILPKSNLKIKNKTGFLHFEKYDFRFRWNSTDSIIDIYLPLSSN